MGGGGMDEIRYKNLLLISSIYCEFRVNDAVKAILYFEGVGDILV
jgi:hypothetical protein